MVEPGTKLKKVWESFHSSILFIPTILTLGALLLFALTSILDTRYAERIAASVEASGSTLLGFLVFGGSPDSAARLLAAIASTWATIVGVVYSVTLVTIQLSATKYSAQVIPVFERDRLNQIVLGTFTATFAYSLLVLKTVRSQDGSTFVPFIGINISIVLALVSLFLLLAFIGNLTAYIRPTRFVEDYARHGLHVLPRLDAPRGIEGYEPTEAHGGEPQGMAVCLISKEQGYVTHVDWVKLRAAWRGGAAPSRIEMRAGLGTWVAEGDEILLAWGVPELDERTRKALLAAFTMGGVPGEDDPTRVADTLADIGVTALSGGATDVGVAKVGIRALLHMVAHALRREPTPRYHVMDAAGRDVLVQIKENRFHDDGFLAIKRILDKAARQGYWDVMESFTDHAGPLVRAAAANEPGTWESTLAFLRPLARQMMAYEDEGSRWRMVRSMRRISTDLRRDGHDVRALDLERILLDAARAEGVDAQLREALAGHA